MGDFQLLSLICLMVIAVILAMIPFLMLRKMDEIAKSLKEMNDRDAMRDYKSQRKVTAEES